MCWGESDYFGDVAKRTGTYKAVAAGLGHTCAINGDDDLLCWGDSSSFDDVAKRTGTYKAVAAGANHTCTINGDNDLLCWGDSSSFDDVAKRTGTYKAVAAGGNHTVAIRATRKQTVKGQLINGEDGRQYQLFVSPFDNKLRLLVPISSD